MLAVAGRPFSKGGAQRSDAWPGACAPAARAAGHGVVDSAISDSDNSDSDSDSDSGSDSGSGDDTAADNDGNNSVDGRVSGDSDTSSTLQANIGERDDSGAGGGSGPLGRFRRSAAPLAQAQPRVGTRSSARLAQRRPTVPDPAFE